jgi:hypothetical protein
MFSIFTEMNYSQDTWLDGHCAADWCLCSRLVSVQQVDLIGLAMCNGLMGSVQQTGVCAADWCLCSKLS